MIKKSLYAVYSVTGIIAALSIGCRTIFVGSVRALGAVQPCDNKWVGISPDGPYEVQKTLEQRYDLDAIASALRARKDYIVLGPDRSIMRSSQLRTLSIHRKFGKVTHGIGLITDGEHEKLEIMSLNLPCSLSDSTIKQQLFAMVSDMSLSSEQRNELRRAIHIRTVKRGVPWPFGPPW